MTQRDDLRVTAAALRRQGLSLSQIARRLHVTISVVARLVADVPFSGHSAESRAEQLASFRDPHLYNRAIELRRLGWSYNMIAAELGVAKSTLSGWLRDVAVQQAHPRVKERVLAGHRKAVQVNKARQQALEEGIRSQADLEMQALLANGLSDREVFLSGLMLYWAEGGKTHKAVSITNSDPSVIQFFILWLQRCFAINLTQIRGLVHLYPDVDIEEAEQYWSEVTGIPRRQFYKAHVDRRTNKLTDNRGKLKFGTVDIKVLGPGVTNLHRKILAYISSFSESLNEIARE